MEDKILDKSTRFKVNIWGIKVPMSIKPLRLGTLIYISKYARMVNNPGQMKDFVGMIGTSDTNAKPLVRIIAMAILNSRFKIRLFSRTLSAILLWKLSPKELNPLLAIIINQSEITDFFLATTLALRITPEAGVVTSPEEKPSGDKSPE